MTTADIPLATRVERAHDFFEEQAARATEQLLPQFDRIVRTHAFVHLLFLTTATILFLYLATSFTLLLKSMLFAVSLGLFVLTLFFYFTIRLYLEAKKSEQMEKLYLFFLRAAQHLLHYREEAAEHQIAIANALSRVASDLQGREWLLYPMPRWLGILSPLFEKVSCWWHWEEVHQLRERFLLGAVEFSIRLVKCAPTSLEAHAALANTYVALSGLYVVTEEERWMRPALFERFERAFRKTAGRAIEEFKILSGYAPDDPWVHLQLAYSYRDLKMPDKEIEEYEILLQLSPGDNEVLYKLGVLYFQQGMNEQGLSIYEKLRRSKDGRAEKLINYYGAYEAAES